MRRARVGFLFRLPAFRSGQTVLSGIHFPTRTPNKEGKRWLAAFFVTGITALPVLAEAANPPGQAVIRGSAGSSEIVISTTERVAGAIDSLTWNGKEFIDSADHGRQLQSASNLDCGTPIQCETYNPTEAGACRDGAGERSSSRLLFFAAGNDALQSVSQMAFWLAPGETSEISAGHPAKNTTVLSNHLLAKHVRIGHPGLPHVIDYNVMFTVPVGERHTEATFEALTAYMPPEFSRFLRFDEQTGRLEPISDGPGENPDPVVLSTPDGSHAMGIFAPPQQLQGMIGPGYGRFRFAEARVVKWNCVFRVRDPAGIPSGTYPFRMHVVVGDLETVRNSLQTLQREAAVPRAY